MESAADSSQLTATTVYRLVPLTVTVVLPVKVPTVAVTTIAVPAAALPATV